MKSLRGSSLGVSFSLHRCYELGVSPKKVLTAAIKDLSFRRFRLMSYWNLHERQPGIYNFYELDWQMDLLAKHGCSATLCLGKRQPRWPECHMPDWALGLPEAEWQKSLLDYIAAVVGRYKGHPALESWQLENEALLRSFGVCRDGDYSHARLRREFKLIKTLDATHPLIMTLSDSWGLPWRGPKPDIYAMSLYRNTINKKGVYTSSKRRPGFYHARAWMIHLLKNRPVFIHELQAEPWLNKPITEAHLSEQTKLFDAKTLERNVAFARRTQLYPIDLWGLEWWYWLYDVHKHPDVWKMAAQIIKN